MPLFGRAQSEIPNSPERWGEALEAALRVSEIASSAMPLPNAIQGMVRTAIGLLDAEQGSIMLLDDSGQELVLVASEGLPSEAQPGQRVHIGEGVAGRVLATGKPLLLGEVDRDAFVNFVPKSRPISSSVVVPLRAQGRSIGVLNLAISERSPDFTDEDLRVAQMFADQVAGLIYRARLHERAEQRSADLMALVDSSRGLLGTLDLEVLLQQVIEGAARLGGAKQGFACIFDPESGAISRGVYRSMDTAAIPAVVADQAVRSAAENADIAMLESPDLGPLVAIGMHTSRWTRGLIVLAVDHEAAEERSDLLRAYGQQCALALGSAELYAEVERKESELSSIIRGVPHPIVLVDAARRLVAVNPGAEQLFNVSGSFSIGAAVQGALGNSELEQLLTGEDEVQTELLAGTPPRTFKVMIANVRVPGAPVGRVLIMDDVTTEREMIQTHRDFVAMIGHELRTPLTIVKGFAGTLLRRIKTASVDEAREALSTIQARSQQLERLIEDLLYVSQIESREASLRTEMVDVTLLARAVVEDLLTQYPDREVELEIASSLEWPCDETKVGLVLRHLVENALKYSKAPSLVAVRASVEEKELRVDVLDKGMGILSTDLPRIFERFRQVDQSSTRQHGGTGVGLYLCAQLIRVHQGRIWADSAWGKGSTFSFSLPRRSMGKEVVTIHSPQDRQAEETG